MHYFLFRGGGGGGGGLVMGIIIIGLVIAVVFLSCICRIFKYCRSKCPKVKQRLLRLCCRGENQQAGNDAGKYNVIKFKFKD